MAYTTINKSTDHFAVKLWTGNGSTQNITGLDFQPDWVWLKNRDASNQEPCIYDALRGVQQRIFTSTNGGNSSSGTGGLTAFNSDGYTLGSAGNNNGNGVNYVGWNWKANGQGSSNTDGTINTTYTSVNSTAGFSISTYTGTGSNATFGHGLGVKPKMFIIKRTSGNEDWAVYHESMTASYYMNLNTNAEQQSNNRWNGEPDTSVIKLQTHAAVNGNGDTYVCYAFAEKAGYSKFGKYIGNGNADGTFVYTGFKPAFIMVKRYDGAGLSWRTFDEKRNYNGDREFYYANLNDAEVGGDNMDFLSNGFKNRNTSGHQNGNSDDYIYMAFGQSLVGTNNIPATAR